MKRFARAALGVVGGAVVMATPLAAQGYHFRLDTRMQSVSFLGVNDIELEGMPLVSTLDGALWGFGIQGLSIRMRARVSADLEDQSVWPGTDPAVQLLEGYAEYATRRVTVQAGRTHVISRLGYTGFDGARVNVRPGIANLNVSAFGGWGLARGEALPINNPDINPLSDFIPTERQLLMGGTLGWSGRRYEGRLVYQREVLPNGSDESALGGERGAAEVSIRPIRGLTVAGGAEYDLARGEFNTGEGSATYRDGRGRFQLSAGGRYYRPYFDLWTIWGVFGATPYSALFGSAQIVPLEGVQVWTSAETYSFDSAGVNSPIAGVEDDGWRWSLGAGLTRLEQFTFGATYHVEATNGASSLGFDAQALFHPMPEFAMRAAGGYRKRPLEYRINEAKVWNYGLRVDYEPVPGVELNAEARRYDETRERANAVSVDFDQWRLHFGVTLTYGSGADRPSLHPAILRIPQRRSP